MRTEYSLVPASGLLGCVELSKVAAERSVDDEARERIPSSSPMVVGDEQKIVSVSGQHSESSQARNHRQSRGTSLFGRTKAKSNRDAKHDLRHLSAWEQVQEFPFTSGSMIVLG